MTRGATHGYRVTYRRAFLPVTPHSVSPSIQASASLVWLLQEPFSKSLVFSLASPKGCHTQEQVCYACLCTVFRIYRGGCDGVRPGTGAWIREAQRPVLQCRGRRWSSKTYSTTCSRARRCVCLHGTGGKQVHHAHAHKDEFTLCEKMKVTTSYTASGLHVRRRRFLDFICACVLPPSSPVAELARGMQTMRS